MKELNEDGTYTYYKYDSNNNLIKEVYVYSDGDESITTYIYDSNGCLIEEDRGYEILKYTYNLKRHLTKAIEINDDIATATTEYDCYMIFFSFPGI